MGILSEFREFAVKGNAVDMAVGIVVGAGFTKVVQSIVQDILMPPIGLLVGGVPFKALEIPLRTETVDGVETVTVAIHYGSFINTVVEFAIVAFSAFMVVKVMNRLIALRSSTEATDA